MLRLLAPADDSRWKEAAARLRDVAIESDAATIDACAGVIVAGPEPSDVEQWLRAGKHVLAVPHNQDLTWHNRLGCARTVHNRDGCATQFLTLNPDRYLPSRQLIKQMIPDKIGQVGLIRMHGWGDLSLSALDTVLWLAGQSPNCIYALERNDGRFRQVHLGFPGGAMALIDVDGRLPAGEGYQSLSVIGSSGAAYADDHQNMQLLYRGGHPQAVKTEEGIKQTVGMLQAFVESIRTGNDPTAWPEVFAVAAAVEESIRTKQAIHREGR